MISTFHLTYGVVSKPLEGEIENGDQWLIKESSNSVLIAIVDGLGHGKDAAFAAKKALTALDNIYTSDATLLDLMNYCHAELQGSRGVVMTLIKIQENYEVTWLGVGNIIGFHWTNRNSTLKKEELFPQSGVVGYQMPSLKTGYFKAGPQATLILATDGLNYDFTNEIPTNRSSQQIADELFKKYHNIHDDATILVIRWEYV
jgi:negative regulator of sigma-B (phosphoserine phosphatase)